MSTAEVADDVAGHVVAGCCSTVDTAAADTAVPSSGIFFIAAVDPVPVFFPVDQYRRIPPKLVVLKAELCQLLLRGRCADVVLLGLHVVLHTVLVLILTVLLCLDTGRHPDRILSVIV